MARLLTFSYFLLQGKFCVSARVVKSLARYLSSSVYTAFRPCRKKVYLRLYFIQIVHSYGKMLFLTPNNCASLTFFKEKLRLLAHVSKSLPWTVFTCVEKMLSFGCVCCHENEIEVCIPGSIWQKNSKFLIEWQKYRGTFYCARSIQRIQADAGHIQPTYGFFKAFSGPRTPPPADKNNQ